MKKLLPVLLCYVLSASQTYALSGGPIFNSNGSSRGSYSGVIEGITEVDNGSTTGPAIPGDPVAGGTAGSTPVPSNALGLFNLSVPATGFATGSFILFEDGTVFNGTITATAPTGSNKLVGIIEASFTTVLFSSTDIFGDTATETTTSATAVGKITAKATGGAAGSSNLGRLTGTANLDVSFGQVDSNNEPVVARSTTFNVIGIKQTSVAISTGSSTGTATSTGTGL